MEEASVMAYTAAGHKGAEKIIRLHISGSSHVVHLLYTDSVEHQFEKV